MDRTTLVGSNRTLSSTVSPVTLKIRPRTASPTGTALETRAHNLHATDKTAGRGHRDCANETFTQVLLHFEGDIFRTINAEVDCDGVEDFWNTILWKTASTTAPMTCTILPVLLILISLESEKKKKLKILCL